jgi:hypothetical protein
LLKEITDLNGDVWMAELMWVYWGKGALHILDDAMPALNPHLRWWKFGQKKNTIRSLLKQPAESIIKCNTQPVRYRDGQALRTTHG